MVDDDQHKAANGTPAGPQSSAWRLHRNSVHINYAVNDDESVRSDGDAALQFATTSALPFSA